MVDKTTTAQ